MPPRKVRIEFIDGEGNKHTLAIEGRISREAISRLLDYVELMGGSQPSPRPTIPLLQPKNKFERVKQVILHELRGRSFSSNELRRIYEEIYGEEIGLSTVSTYLLRLSEAGFLNRVGSPSEWRYILNIAAPNPRPRIDLID
ncbi:MAG: hypothetical protein QXU06_04175 [Candidatus Bathyarchaeia archaeon]